MAGHQSSVVWTVFSICERSKGFTICKLCRAKLSRGKRNHTTSPLWAHLRSKHFGTFQKLKRQEKAGASSRTPGQSQESHPEEPQELEVSPEPCTSPGTGSVYSEAPSVSPTAVGEQPDVCKRHTGQPSDMSVPAMFQRKQPLKPGGMTAVTITKLIAEMICLDQQPFSMVEKVGFRRLINFLESQYTVPSREYIAEKIIPEMYAHQRARVSALLERTDHVALTTDMWTCTEDYISLTAHFVDKEDFSFQHVFLECVPFKGIAHTGAAISKFLMETLQEWRLTEKVVCIVHNGANIMSGLGTSGFPNVPCLAHTLQLVIKDGLLTKGEVTAVLQSCRSVLGHYEHFPTAMEVLHAAQAEIRLPLHCLIRDEPTCWISQLHMMRRLLEQREAVEMASAELDFPMPLSLSKWHLMEDIVQLLQMFHIVTIRVSTASSTISEVLPIVNTISQMLHDYKSPWQLVNALVKDLLVSLSWQYQSLEKEEKYVVSTLLDPRFKDSVFGNKQQTVEYGKARLLQLMRDLSAGDGSQEEDAPQPETSAAATQPPPAPSPPTGAARAEREGLEMLHRIFQTFHPHSQKSAEDVLLQDELDAYLKEANIPPEADIFSYWKSAWQYPNLRSLAQRFLVTPASTAASEQLFSTSGLNVDQKQSTLNPERVRMLVFLNKNLPR